MFGLMNLSPASLMPNLKSMIVPESLLKVKGLMNSWSLEERAKESSSGWAELVKS